MDITTVIIMHMVMVVMVITVVVVGIGSVYDIGLKRLLSKKIF